MTGESPHLFYQSRQPRPFLDRGEGIYLYDQAGKRYIDGSSGAMVSNIGHSNPRVLAKMKAQMDKATFGYRLHFRTEPSEKLAAKTASLMPEGLDRVFFVSGGSEAVETAIKLARQYALAKGQERRHKVISRFPSYHGCTLGALALTGYDPLARPFAPMMRDMPKVPAPRTYLDRDNLTEEERGLKYAGMLRERIEAHFEVFAKWMRDKQGVNPELVIREGDPVNEILSQVRDDPEIGVLVLGAGTEKAGPGPLVTATTMAQGRSLPPSVAPPAWSSLQRKL